jgi:hypothetical protein
MAQSYVTEAGTLIIPGSVASIKVETSNSGLSTTGVLMLVGEADGGPRFNEEDDLQANAFGPDQLAAVIAKYQGGPLVDAFRTAASPANDPNIVGSPSRMIIVKTNLSTKGASALTVHGGGAYLSASGAALSIADKGYGKLGNLIYWTLEAATAEALPTVGSFTALLSPNRVDASVRVNGGTSQPLVIGALTTPDDLKEALDALTGVTCTGGASRGLLDEDMIFVPDPASGNTLALTVLSGNTVRIDTDGSWAGATPVAGDTLFIPSDSVIKGAADQNVGSYVVTSATSNSVFATKLLDGSGLPGALTAPASVAAAEIVAVTDLLGWEALSLGLSAGNPLAGQGKSLEINELTTGTDLLSDMLYVGTSRVSWISKTGAPVLVVSGAEYRAKLLLNRQRDNIQEELVAGGEIALKIGYLGTTATLTIDDSELTTTVTGGAGEALSLELKDFPTVSDLATFINSKPGYTATVTTAILGQLPSVALDNVASMGICSTFGEKPGRLKIDGYRFFNKVNGDSVLVQLQNAAGVAVQAGAGLPQPVAAITYLSGGDKGGTTDADVASALLALEKVRGNFLVPLFSRDATLDKADRLTEDGSSYTIEAINAGARSHVLKMSALKKRRNRQAFISLKDSFANDRLAAANTASFRCAFPFQDIRNPGGDGSIKQFQPWMGAVVAAGMQAAAFYKAIVRKFANISGALQAARDFDDQDDTQMEDALQSGLLPLRKAETGGWYWVSDQTTYGKDSNFVFNSIQATYVADIIALTTAQRMENAFVGQSVADVNAALAMAFLESIMEDFIRLKLIAPSDDAPRGFKNAKIKISGTAMIVSIEVKLAGAIYFIPISFLVSQVTQSA